MAPKDDICTGVSINLQGFISECGNSKLAEKIVQRLEKSRLDKIIQIDLELICYTNLVEFWKNAEIVKDGLSESISTKVNGKQIIVTEQSLEKLLGLNRGKSANEDSANPKNVVYDKVQFWKIIAKDEDSEVKFSGKGILLKYEFMILAQVMAKCIEGKSGSFDAITTVRVDLMAILYLNKSFNWAGFVLNQMIEQIRKEKKNVMKDDVQPIENFVIKKTFGLLIQQILDLLKVDMVNPVQLNVLKKRFAPSKSLGSKVPKPVKKKAKTTHTSAATTSKSAEPKIKVLTRSAAKKVDDETEVFPIAEKDDSISETSRLASVERLINWLTWKLSRSNIQLQNAEFMIQEEEWVLDLLNENEFYTFIDSTSLVNVCLTEIHNRRKAELRKDESKKSDTSDDSDGDDHAPVGDNRAESSHHAESNKAADVVQDKSAEPEKEGETVDEIIRPTVSLDVSGMFDESEDSDEVNAEDLLQPDVGFVQERAINVCKDVIPFTGTNVENHLGNERIENALRTITVQLAKHEEDLTRYLSSRADVEGDFKSKLENLQDGQRDNRNEILKMHFDIKSQQHKRSINERIEHIQADAAETKTRVISIERKVDMILAAQLNQAVNNERISTYLLDVTKKRDEKEEKSRNSKQSN